MQLTWSKTTDIVRALLEAYPEVERVNLPAAELLFMIVNLPNFDDTKTPPNETYLEHILWSWMRMADDSFGAAA